MEMKAGAYPSIFPFITLRHERFGALLFNPYFGRDYKLGIEGAFIATLCDGHHSPDNIIRSVRQRFCLSSDDAKIQVSETFELLLQAYAMDFFPGTRSRAVKYPAIPEFKDGCPALSAPRTVVWEVTYQCNLHCHHCLTSSGSAIRGELDTRQALELIQWLADARIFTLTVSGGEPFLRPDIVTLLRRVSNIGIRPDVLTNGVFIKNEIIKGLRSFPTLSVIVSIDGIGELHDRLRCHKGAFDAACKNIIRLKKEGINVGMNSTMNADNVHCLEQLIGLAIKLGCSSFTANTFIPMGRGILYADRLELSAGERLYVHETLMQKRKELEGILHIPPESCDPYLIGPSSARVASDGSMGCSSGYDILCIGADGTLYPCSFLRDFPLGSALEKPLREIWNESPVLKDLRSLEKGNISEPCRSCKLSPGSCDGGCRARAYVKYRDLKAADPFCIKQLRNGKGENKIST